MNKVYTVGRRCTRGNFNITKVFSTKINALKYKKEMEDGTSNHRDYEWWDTESYTLYK